MRIWTVQHKGLWEDLKRNGIAFCNAPTMADDPDTDQFGNAYTWMEKQMEHRVPAPRPESAKHLIWGWAQYGNHKKTYHPDTTQYNGGNYVCFELDVPEEELLLSDFSLWNCILNEGVLGDKELDKRIDSFLASGNGFVALKDYPGELKDAVIKSWDRIFDLRTQDRHAPTHRRNRTIQATFWYIKESWIRGWRIY